MIIVVIVKNVGRKISRGFMEQYKDQDKKNCTSNPPSICPFYQWWAGGTLIMHPGLTSKECCITIN